MRENVGVVDVSTLGKIELQGRDVAEFLNRIYIPLGYSRDRPMPLRRHAARGRVVLDDGTTARLSATHYLMTTTTVNASR